jgi:hypothetical protein
VVCVEMCDLDSDVNAVWEVDVDVGVGVEGDVELVIVIVTVVTISVFWDVDCDGFCDPVIVPLSELVVMGTVGGNRTWPPGTCEGAFPPSALVATTREPAAASTTRVNTETTDSF